MAHTVFCGDGGGVILRKKGVSLTPQTCRAKLCSVMSIRDASSMTKIRSLAKKVGRFPKKEEWHDTTFPRFPRIRETEKSGLPP